MPGPDRYRTVAGDGEAEIEVKRSRFRCRLARVESEESARAIVEEARRTHWDARHHCSAFRLGPRGDVQRSSDDGEPSGTAGAPMLEVLARREVSDLVAVVTRWFGGTLLGTGGLVRAYSDAVATALDQVGIRERRLMQRLDVRVGHATAGRLEGTIRNAAMVVHDVEFRADHAVLSLAVPTDAVERTVADVAAWSAGSAETTLHDLEWVDA